MKLDRVLLSLGALLLAACEGHEVRETLGLERNAPDEFTVVSRPPLSVPKEFYLYPPRPGEDVPLGQDAEDTARALVTGTAAEASLEAKESGLADTAAPVVTEQPLASTGEENLLKRVGAEQADPNVREKLYDESAAAKEQEPDVIDRLRGETNTDPVVDAQAEAERLKKNKEEGKPVTEGDVPVTDPKQKSVLERVFE